MITQSQYIKSENILKFQTAVKNSGCRFVNFKAFSSIKSQYVVIEGSSKSLELCNSQFYRLTTGIKETTRKKSIFKKTLNKLNRLIR